MGDTVTNGTAETETPPSPRRGLLRHLELMDNWRLAPRFWSVRIKTAATALQGAFLVWPTFALDLWNMMPVQLSQHLPARTVFAIPLVLFIASGIAQFIKQRKLGDAGLG